MVNSKNRQNSLEDIYNCYLKMKKNNISLSYEGEITHQITKAFTSLIENNMIQDEDYTSVQRKVFHVMVECMQNISKHAEKASDAPYTKNGKGIFMISKSKNEYNVTSGNLIKVEQQEKLTKTLEHINSLDKKELNKLYKQQMREGRLSEKGGAGLGFIDIARKTGEKILFNFLEIDDENSLFVLTTTISRLKD